jgi:hypothetical protein
MLASMYHRSEPNYVSYLGHHTWLIATCSELSHLNVTMCGISFPVTRSRSRIEESGRQNRFLTYVLYIINVICFSRMKPTASEGLGVKDVFYLAPGMFCDASALLPL